MDYASAQAREPARYAPAAALPPEVVLVDGKVTCTSCHDAASPHPKRAADRRGSAGPVTSREARG